MSAASSIFFLFSIAVAAAASKHIFIPTEKNLGVEHFDIKETEIPTGEDYVKEDAKGKYIECASSLESGEATKCYVPEDEDKRSKVFACYALYGADGQARVQDCWVQQEASVSNCLKDRCEETSSARGISFCCCFGHMCNSKFSYKS